MEQRKRVYVTDSQSAFDYLHKDRTSTSSDKRMAIEGALLRETVRRPHAEVRWIDGEQNLADILTKPRVDKGLLMEFMRTGLLSLVQTEANKELKEKKRAQRQARKKVVKSDEKKWKERNGRIQKVAAEMKQRAADDGESYQKKKKECENSMQFTALLPVASCRPIAAYFRSRPRLQLAPYWPAVHGPLEG